MIEQKINETITPVIKDMGYELVYVRLKGDSNSQVLTVMAENPATKNLGVDECASISKAISAVLDVEDLIKNAYSLEVSSPGIDRMLTRKKDFNDYAGYEVKIEIAPPLEGQKRFRGCLIGEKNGIVSLKTEDQGEVAFPYDSVHKAKLVMSDALIKKTHATD